MKKVTTKKTRSVNNRPNCLKITKGTQKVNFTTVTDKDGNKIKTSVREARTMKKNSKKDDYDEWIYIHFFIYPQKLLINKKKTSY